MAIKTTIALMFCALLNLPGQTEPQIPPKQPGSDADELVAIERQRSEAIAKHDSSFLRNLYADEFRGVTAAGYVVDKATLLDVFSRDNPQVKFMADQLEARIFGNTAVVQRRLTGKDVASGKTIHESKYLHVYVKENGRWRIVAGQGTMVQPPKD